MLQSVQYRKVALYLDMILQLVYGIKKLAIVADIIKHQHLLIMILHTSISQVEKIIFRSIIIM